jgi:hypothetical protein
MLRTQLQHVAFAYQPSTASAALDILRGLDGSTPPAARPIVFPGAGMTTDLTTYAGREFPVPLCLWHPPVAHTMPGGGKDAAAS